MFHRVPVKSNHILIGLCDWFTCENLISKKFVMIMLEHIRSSHLSKRKEGHNNIIRYISHFGEITLSDIFVPPHTPATPSHRSPPPAATHHYHPHFPVVSRPFQRPSLVGSAPSAASAASLLEEGQRRPRLHVHPLEIPVRGNH